MDENQIKRLVEKTIVEIQRKENSVLHQSEVVPRTIKPHHIETVFGNMYAYQAAITVTVAAADTWYEVTSGLTDGGQSDGVVFQNSHELKVNYGGKFLAVWSLSFSTASANQELMGGIGVNGTINTASVGESVDSTANDAMTTSGNIILNLSAGDLVSFFVHNETLSTDIVIEHATLTLIRIGR